MDIEKSFISKVILERCIGTVLEENLPDAVFVEHLNIWKWLKDEFRKHGDIPPLEIFEKQWAGFTLQNIDGPVSYLVEELRTRRIQTILLESLQKQAAFIKAGDPKAALDAARGALVCAELETRPTKDINIVDTVNTRIKNYCDNADTQGFMGIPSPWPVLDKMSLGFQPEDLTMLAGRGKTGKTWVELIIAWHQWCLGYTPMVISKEMSAHQIIRRLDAINANLPYQKFKAGALSEDEFQRWQKKLEEMQKARNPLWVIADNANTGGVAGIEAKLTKYNPSILIIDGFYILSDDRKSKNKWERIYNVAEDLKTLAQRRGIPIIISHQFSSDGKDNKGTEDTLKFGDVQMWMDNIIGIYRTEEHKANKEILFKVLKWREGEEIEWVCTWDFERMDFSVYKEGAEFIPPNRYDGENIEY